MPTNPGTAPGKPRKPNRGKDGTHPLVFREGDHWRDLKTILANCDEVMLSHGWERRGENGRDFFNKRTAKPSSDLWYAVRIGAECWDLLNWPREHGPNEIALSRCLYLGLLLAEAKWLLNAKTGEGLRAGNKESQRVRELAAPDYEGEFRRLAAWLQREGVYWTLHDIWVKIGKTFGKHPRTVERAVKKEVPEYRELCPADTPSGRTAARRLRQAPTAFKANAVV